MLHVRFNNPKRDESSVKSIFEGIDGFKCVHAMKKPSAKQTTHSYCVEFATGEHAAAARTLCDGYEHDVYKLVSIGTFCPVERFKEAETACIKLSDAGYEALIGLYLLADKLQDLATTNMIMDELIHFSFETSQNPKHRAVSLAYGSTPNTSPLRRLMRNYWVHRVPKNGSELIADNDYPKEFLRDNAAEMMRDHENNAEGEDPDTCSETCRYHQHDESVPRCNL